MCIHLMWNVTLHALNGMYQHGNYTRWGRGLSLNPLGVPVSYIILCRA
jgi:hypothetical protein